MKKANRILCYVIAFIMILSVQVYAEEATPRASSYFSAYEAYLDRTSSTSFDVWFDVIATGNMQKLGTSVIKVQRSSDGSNWYTVRTYTKEMYPQMVCANTFTHADCVSYTSMEPGFYYRAHVEFYAKNSSGTGSFSYYTKKL